MSSVAVLKRIAAMRAELDAAMAESVDGSAAERTAATAEFEALVRQLPALQHRLVNGLGELPVEELGEPSLAAALSTLLRISREEASRRIKEAKDLGPRVALTGEPLDPMLSNTAAAQLRGDIGVEHVKIIRKFFKDLPGFVDHDTREAAETQLAELACGLGPDQLRKAADRLAMILDQDGELSDADRVKRSYFTKGRQRADGMSELRGSADPELTALLDVVFAKWAAPGMCNPDHEAPGVDGEPSPEAIRKDLRTAGQRNHDALKALCRALLASGQLGSHKGLPMTMVVSTTLKELQSGAGHAVTGGGTLLPMREVIKQAAAAHQYLCVFDDHTAEALYLGRAKRLASKAQRLVLYARDRGCTFPGCTAPAYHSEAHHRNGDWSQGGLTNIDDLTLACGTDNRRVKPGGWTTRTRADGRTEWIPPPNLDTGQRRVNNYHHPERYLIPDEHATENSEGDEDEST
ncbi:HNH endonuclease signature motif containing protein [Mycobacterium sp. ITM-2016-00318]|uniref:HNH endonuclease signature motif containing protein n=1 Tax=Mycobacterium sp. ITM-2016-00318 TaxID=2099693 RepID=UPI00287F4663|nr:HNH endonuclease signature motif containing protein [Mycobacterium sp. ITM-2016-00318]WNG90948.1 HNH endonuclease signature motif containing protein [Mycobacterium sp. ITM-2016-00318]